jgi:hypothetical protein
MGVLNYHKTLGALRDKLGIPSPHDRIKMVPGNLALFDGSQILFRAAHYVNKRDPPVPAGLRGAACAEWVAGLVGHLERAGLVVALVWDPAQRPEGKADKPKYGPPPITKQEMAEAQGLLDGAGPRTCTTPLEAEKACVAGLRAAEREGVVFTTDTDAMVLGAEHCVRSPTRAEAARLTTGGGARVVREGGAGDLRAVLGALNAKPGRHRHPYAPVDLALLLGNDYSPSIGLGPAKGSKHLLSGLPVPVERLKGGEEAAARASFDMGAPGVEEAGKMVVAALTGPPGGWADEGSGARAAYLLAKGEAPPGAEGGEQAARAGGAGRPAPPPGAAEEL